MRTSFLAFDCETTGFAETDDITCIVTKCVVSDTVTHTQEWHGEFGKYIDVDTLQKCVDYMWQYYDEKKYAIISFNGVKFDFFVMARMLKNYPVYVERIEILALGSEDILLDFATEFGHFSSMASFAKGCKIKGKSNTGAWAAETWKEGTEPGCLAVIDYCAADVQVLCDLVQYRANYKMLHRITKQQKSTVWMSPSPTFRTAQKCITDYTANPVKCIWLPSPPNIPEMWEWIAKERIQ